MRVYYVSKCLPWYTDFYVAINDNHNASHKGFPNPKKAWQYARKLADNYARKHGLQSVYTCHPNGSAQAAYVVQ